MFAAAAAQRMGVRLSQEDGVVPERLIRAIPSRRRRPERTCSHLFQMCCSRWMNTYIGVNHDMSTLRMCKSRTATRTSHYPHRRGSRVRGEFGFEPRLGGVKRWNALVLPSPFPIQGANTQGPGGLLQNLPSGPLWGKSAGNCILTKIQMMELEGYLQRLARNPGRHWTISRLRRAAQFLVYTLRAKGRIHRNSRRMRRSTDTDAQILMPKDEIMEA